MSFISLFSCYNGMTRTNRRNSLRRFIKFPTSVILIGIIILIHYELGRFIFYKTKLSGRIIISNEQMAPVGITNKTSCPLNTKAGPIKVTIGTYNWTDIESKMSSLNISVGGRWRPLDCIPRSRVAVVIPYRNRNEALLNLLLNLHPFLQRQLLDYTIYVVEQSSLHPFNKGATINAGFMEIISRESYDCFIIHDVDVIPEDDRILYQCTDNPRHLSAAIDRWNYKLKYDIIFGGALAVTRQQFESVNGFSNAYFGWGAEDDDFSYRIRTKYKVLRYPIEIARYKNLKHTAEKRNANRYHYYNKWKQRKDKDGINSIKYKFLFLKKKTLFTHIKVEFSQTEILHYVDALLTKSKP